MKQRELGRLIGYKGEGQVSQHELSRTIPPLLVALAYEAVFHVPVSAIFTGFRASVEQMVEDNMSAFEEELRSTAEKDPQSQATAHKLEWITKRKTS